MHIRTMVIVLGLTLLAIAGPLGGTSRADLTCAQACREGQNACVQACNGRPRAGVCKRACRNPRVRRACIRLCKQSGGAGITASPVSE